MTEHNAPDGRPYYNPPNVVGSGNMGGQFEIATTASAMHARAMVEARYGMAMRRPRVMDQVRQDLMRECNRPAFARNKSAFYRKPIGAGVEGLGIRFVEVAFRCMTNVYVETTLTYEDELKEVFQVSVTDLETNVTYPLDVKVSKVVERAKPMDDGTYITARRNSRGAMVFTVPANDDDLLNKRNALISKAMRTLGLRLVPGDLQDEAEEIIKRVRLDEAAKNPEAERHQLADAFNGVGVRAAQLTEYLGHDLGTCTPAELVTLRGIWSGIKEGELTWATVMDEANKAKGAGDKDPAGANVPGAGATRLKERIKKNAQASTAPPAENAPQAPLSASEARDGEGIEATADQLRAAVMAAKDQDAVDLVLDRARHLDRDDYDGLVSLAESRFNTPDGEQA